MQSRKEIQTSVLNTTRQDASDLGNLVNEFINITIREINDPAWAFRNSYNHLWNFLKRKTTFSTVASQEDYVLKRDIDRIALMRQTTSPAVIKRISDEQFYRLVPNPTETGNPKFYRVWETEGVSTRLTADDTIDVVSSSSSDAGDSTLSVSVSGYDTNGTWRTETYQLNGTTAVTGSITFDAGREIFISKQKTTTGSITVTENSGGTTLVVVGPDEQSPRFKVLSFYPIPSSAITIYMEYYTLLQELRNDSDVSNLPEKWQYVIRLGTLAKVYQYLNKETNFLATQSLFSKAVQGMVAADQATPDLIEHLSPGNDYFPFIHQRRTEDAIA